MGDRSPRGDALLPGTILPRATPLDYLRVLAGKCSPRGLLATAVVVALAMPVSASAAALDPGATLLQSRPSGSLFLPVPSTGPSDVDGVALDSSGDLVAFASAANNLSSADDNRYYNVFVRDRQSGTTTLVSRATGASGAAGNGSSYWAAISADGTKVAFTSDATNLVSADTNAYPDIFIRDLVANTTTLVSRAGGADGALSNNYSDVASIGINGSGDVLVAFESSATNLVSGDDNSRDDIFVRNVTDATTELVSRANTDSGAISNAQSRYAHISADGTKVAFTSSGSNLHTSDPTGSGEDVYVRDLSADTTELASRATGADGAKGNQQSLIPFLDADASHVLFMSQASNFDAGATDGTTLHLYRRTLGGTYATELVDRPDGSTNTVGNGRVYGTYSMSPDASKVAFASLATNLTSVTDDNASYDLFVRNLGAGTTTLMSRANGADGALGDGHSFAGWIDSTGTTVAFPSHADNLSTSDDNGVQNVFVRDGAATELVNQPGAPDTGTRESRAGDVSDGGRRVVFVSSSDGLTSDDNDSVANVYVRDNETGATILVSRRADGTAADGDSSSPAITPDGTKVVFRSVAPNLGAGTLGQIFVKDLVSGALTVASRPDGDGTGAGNAASDDPRITPDGRRVVFSSSATNLAAGFTSPGHVYVRDLSTNDTIGVDAADGTAATQNDGSAANGRIDAAGTKVAFDGFSTNLVSPAPATATYVYLRDLSTNQTTIISRNAGGTPVTGSSPELSADAGRLMFVTGVPLDPADSGTTSDVYVRDLASGSVTLATRANGPSGALPNATSLTPRMSRNGQIVVWWSTATNLVSDALSAGAHIFVRNLADQTTETADRADGVDGAQADAPAAFFPRPSPDGCCVAFDSRAGNLVSGWPGSDVFQTFVRNVSKPVTTTVPTDGTPIDGGTAAVSAPATATPVPAPARDVRPPGLRLRAAREQRVLKARRLVVSVVSDEPATVRVTATLNVPGTARVFRLRAVTRALAPGARATLRIKVSRRALAAVGRALARKKRVVATVRVTARDAAGNTAAATRKIRVVR